MSWSPPRTTPCTRSTPAPGGSAGQPTSARRCRRRRLPCGDIAPTVGITSTPVIDPARHEVFVVADMSGAARRRATSWSGLRCRPAPIVLRQDVDPPGINTAADTAAGRTDPRRGQRGVRLRRELRGLLDLPRLDRVGARDRRPDATFEIDAAPGEDQGAVWMGGAAPAVDANGDIWFAAGNGSVDTPSPLTTAATRSWSCPRPCNCSSPSRRPTGRRTTRTTGTSGPGCRRSFPRAGGPGRQVPNHLRAVRRTARRRSAASSRRRLDSVARTSTVATRSRVTVVYHAVPERRRGGPSDGQPAVGSGCSGRPGAGRPPIVAGGYVWAISVSGELDGINRARTAPSSSSSPVGPVAEPLPDPLGRRRPTVRPRPRPGVRVPRAAP